MLQERFPPRVVAPGVLGGVQLECGATGATKIVWNRDGRPLPPHLQTQHSSRLAPHGVLRSTLNITHLTSEEAGLYSCTALSQDNSSSAHHSARLDVYGTFTFKFRINWNVLLIYKSSLSGQPYIRNMLPLKILSGSRAAIYCPYYGYPIRYCRSLVILDRWFVNTL